MHVMIDLETMGLEADAAILQIAAVEFEPVHAGKIYVERAFSVYVDGNSQADRNVNHETLVWWMSQDEVARGHIMAGQETSLRLSRVLSDLHTWFRNTLTGADKVWARGSDFDLSILRHACRDALSSGPPWAYNQTRDLRTYMDVYLISDEGKASARYQSENRMKAAGTEWLKHDALSDCVLQICEFQEVTP